MTQTFLNTRIVLGDVVEAGDLTSRSYAVGVLADLQTEFSENLQLYQSTSDTAEAKAASKPLASTYGAYAAVIDQVVAAVNSGNHTRAAALVSSTVKNKASTFLDQLNLLTKYAEQTARETMDNNIATQDLITTITLSLTLVSLLVSAMIAFGISKSIVKPLESSVRLMQKLAAGDLTTRADPVHLRRKDEVGSLSTAMDRMSQDLNVGLTTVSTASFRLKDTSLELGYQMDEADRVVSDINRGIEVVNEHVINQSTSISETSSASRQILRNLENLDRLIEIQLQNVKHSSASIEEMIKTTSAVTGNIEEMSISFRKLQDSADDGKTKLTNVSDLITRISEESEHLQQANADINAIAGQTDILAMNAAIEAAHAGELGRGFGVVADEIRKLAEQVALQSKEISQNIHTIQEFINQSAQASKVADQSFQTILEQINSLENFNGKIMKAMDHQNAGSQQIVEAIEQIKAIGMQARNSSAEMLLGSQAIEQEMQKLLEGSVNVHGKTGELMNGTREITEAIVLVRTKGDEIIRCSAELANQVGSFKTGPGPNL
jgi:methyl-accepting chemotaxis protein